MRKTFLSMQEQLTLRLPLVLPHGYIIQTNIHNPDQNLPLPCLSPVRFFLQKKADGGQAREGKTPAFAAAKAGRDGNLRRLKGHPDPIMRFSAAPPIFPQAPDKEQGL